MMDHAAWPEDLLENERTLTRLRTGIGKRIQRVCTHMKTVDFDVLVDSMARIQFKYESQAR